MKSTQKLWTILFACASSVITPNTSMAIAEFQLAVWNTDPRGTAKKEAADSLLLQAWGYKNYTDALFDYKAITQLVKLTDEPRYIETLATLFAHIEKEYAIQAHAVFDEEKCLAIERHRAQAFLYELSKWGRSMLIRLLLARDAVGGDIIAGSYSLHPEYEGQGIDRTELRWMSLRTALDHEVLPIIVQHIRDISDTHAVQHEMYNLADSSGLGISYRESNTWASKLVAYMEREFPHIQNTVFVEHIFEMRKGAILYSLQKLFEQALSLRAAEAILTVPI